MKRILFSLFISLLVGTTAWSRHPYEQRALNGHVSVQQQPVPFVIPEAYFILGTPSWLQSLGYANRSLNTLYLLKEEAESDNVDVQQAYKSYLSEYVSAVARGIMAIRIFFLFENRLNDAQRVLIADRLLSVVSEYNQFWGVEHYCDDFVEILEHTDQDLQRRREEVTTLERRLFMLLHEADDMLEEDGD